MSFRFRKARTKTGWGNVPGIPTSYQKNLYIYELILPRVNPPPKGYSNTIHHIKYDEKRDNSRYNWFEFYGKQDKPTIIIKIEDKTAFKQVYKELFNEEYKGY